MITLYFVMTIITTGCFAVDSLRFFVIGDMGGIPERPYYTYFERCTAEEMGQMAELYSPHFILELGDNFYYDGVTSVDDPRFQLTFENVYTAKSLVEIPWYLVAGNHDHNGNVSAQIAYSKISNRWNFPDFYYYLELPYNSNQDSIGFVMMDTIVLCGNTEHDFVSTPPQGPKNVDLANQQWKFIEKSLEKSNAKYLFTAGHYPVYSVAEHGPTACLLEGLEPLLEKYNVNGHMSGHDHNLQHLQVKKGSTKDYFVSGMANFIDPSLKHLENVPKDSLKFHNAAFSGKGGFLYAEVTSQNMTLTFIDANGNKLYQTNVFPRR